MQWERLYNRAYVRYLAGLRSSAEVLDRAGRLDLAALRGTEEVIERAGRLVEYCGHRAALAQIRAGK